jgi:hypothetical protein
MVRNTKTNKNNIFDNKIVFYMEQQGFPVLEENPVSSTLLK